MFIPLREGLGEIREIVVNLINENGKEIKILENITTYLHLKEE